MKKVLLLALMTGCYSSHAQTIKFKPEPEDWRATATPQQMADTARALQARYELAKQKVNLLRALNDIAQDRADDSIAAVRAAQLKKWSRMPKATKKRPVKKTVK